MPIIEKDALKNTPDAPNTGASFISTDDAAQFIAPHRHDIKSFIATPRQDPTLLERFRALFKSELKPGQYITKGADGLRYMFLITSNSYEDRDNETITSKALEHYEASCYPGENLFHCDNPLLWWHDDDVPMGDIVAVNYSTPFLVEVAKELPSPTARILWDYAEKNGDKAGASHRFGYRDEDRQPDGSYTHIVKQETSYLPERELAANIMTYAGVIDKTMSTQQSDARLNQVFSEATGGKIQEAAKLIHAKSGELDKQLAALGITHKAKADVPPGEETPADAPEGEAPEEEQKQDLPGDFMAKLQQLQAIYALCMELVGAQAGMMDAQVEMAKSIKAVQDERVKEKAASDTMEQRLAALEAWRKLTPRSASQNAPVTDIDKLTRSLEAAKTQAIDAELVDSPVGKIKPPLDYGNGKG